MVPDRIVRDEILTSERYWRVSDEARLLYLHVLLSADDTGRFSGKNFTLRTRCFPGRPMESDRMEGLLRELMDVDLLRVYMHDAERFVFIPRFRQKLRSVKSKYPPPPQEIDDVDPESLPDVSQWEWLRIRREVIERDGGKCIRCKSVEKLAAHHVVPRSRGGRSDMTNLVTLCQSCNSWARTNEDRCKEINELFERLQGKGNANAKHKRRTCNTQDLEEKRRVRY
jgi:hypothetical protein